MNAALIALLLAGLAAEGPSPEVPELRPLAHYAGNWTAESTVKPGPGLPDGAKRIGTAQGEWVLGGRFLRQTWKIDPAAGQPELSGMTLMTYDPQLRRYRSWGFVSTGSAQEAEGKWDADARTFTWTARAGDGGPTTVTKAAFGADGEESWSIVTKDPDGRTLMEMSGRNRKAE